ncbi:hypothetical protein O181_009748 [Austropuccinia psidii MF-1]|uniref:Integrase zinc-binding domain-containing protein n=1 Tax=Austropuccinia psidii MF-1 TaxID=1389203 RepID=A0A9Q3GJQ5_9BASI|nr:hypothetical protein [Austropuccinia psidii MF-1]
MFKKLQTVLWVQHFELQVDAKASIQMINSPCLPNAPMTRWVAFIQLFSFELVHKPGKTITMPDGLSRRPQSEDEEKEKSDFDEEEQWMKTHPGFGVKHNNKIRFSGIKIPSKQKGFWKRMEEYLDTLKSPFGSKEDDFKKTIRKSSNFFLEEGQLKRRNKPNPQVVLSSQSSQRRILKSSHEKMGHRGESETYRRVKEIFWWEGMKKMVKNGSNLVNHVRREVIITKTRKEESHSPQHYLKESV